MSVACAAGNFVISVSWSSIVFDCVVNIQQIHADVFFITVLKQVRQESTMGYLNSTSTNKAAEFGNQILTFLILFNSFIPIR